MIIILSLMIKLEETIGHRICKKYLEEEGSYNKLCTDSTLFTRFEEEGHDARNHENDGNLCQHEWYAVGEGISAEPQTPLWIYHSKIFAHKRFLTTWHPDVP